VRFFLFFSGGRSFFLRDRDLVSVSSYWVNSSVFSGGLEVDECLSYLSLDSSGPITFALSSGVIFKLKFLGYGVFFDGPVIDCWQNLNECLIKSFLRV